MDGAAVRTLAARLDAVAAGLDGEVTRLRALQATDWVGPAAALCGLVVAERLAAAGEVQVRLGEASAALRAHAAAADEALTSLRVALALGGASAQDLLAGGAAVLRGALAVVGTGRAVSRW